MLCLVNAVNVTASVCISVDELGLHQDFEIRKRESGLLINGF